MIFDHVEWDEDNLDHATRRLIRSLTDGGKRVLIVVQLVHHGVRPITGWKE